MSELKFMVDLSQAMRAGTSCRTAQPVSIEVDPSRIAPDDREVIAARMVGCEVRQMCEGQHQRTLVTAAAPTIEALLVAIRAEDRIAADAAAERAAVDAKRSRARVAKAIEWAAAAPVPQWYTTDDGLYYQGVAADHAIAHEMAAALPEVGEKLASLRAKNSEAQKAALAARREWISEHGSPRLRLLLAESLPVQESYQQERKDWEDAAFAAALATELPGWQEPTELLYPPREPSLAALLMVGQARQKIATARLMRHGYDGPYVAVAEFRGRNVIWPPQD